MSIFNKLAVVHTPLPLTIVTVQMAFTVLTLLPNRSALTYGSARDVTRWAVTVPLLFVAMLASSMLALQYATLGTIVVCRNVAPIATMLIERCFRVPFAATAHTVGALSIIVVGVALYERGDVAFSPAAMCAIALNMVFAVLERIMQRHLMANDPVRGPCARALRASRRARRARARAGGGRARTRPEAGVQDTLTLAIVARIAPSLARRTPPPRCASRRLTASHRCAAPSPRRPFAAPPRGGGQVTLSKGMMMMLNNAIGAPPCLLLAAAMGEHVRWTSTYAELTPRALTYLLVSCLNGLAISYAGIRLQHLVTATTFMVVTNVNKFAVILFGIAAFNDTVLRAARTLGFAGAPRVVRLLQPPSCRAPLASAPRGRAPSLRRPRAAPPQAGPTALLGCMLAICGGIYYAEARKRADAAGAAYAKVGQSDAAQTCAPRRAGCACASPVRALSASAVAALALDAVDDRGVDDGARVCKAAARHGSCAAVSGSFQ